MRSHILRGVTILILKLILVSRMTDQLGHIAPDTLSNDISSSSYNSSPWNSEQSFVKFKSDKVILHKDNLFGQLKIDDTSPLHQIVDRSVCPSCHRSLKFFCYDCYLPLENTKNLIPKITTLPCLVDVVKHPAEVAGKVSRHLGHLTIKSRFLFFINILTGNPT